MVESGISPQVVLSRGYYTATKKQQLEQRGFHNRNLKPPALVIPICTVHGDWEVAQLRPDNPRSDTKGKKLKYEFPPDQQMLLDVPPGSWPFIRDPSIPLFITEGVRKADAAVSRALCCIDLLGVWNFRGTNEFGGLTALADWEYIAFKSKDGPRDVYIVFDSDVMTKRPVYQALCRLQRFLEHHGARVWLIYLPTGEMGKKVGLDDWLVSLPGQTSTDEIMWMLQSMATQELKPLPSDAGGDDHSDAFPGSLRRQYDITPDGLYHLRTTARGVMRIQLTNFRTRVLRSIVRDDGVSLEHWFEVDAARNHHRFQGLLRLTEYNAMEWPAKDLMAAAGVLPGNGTREQAAFGFLQLSEPICEARVYGHTGWRDDVRVRKAGTEDEYVTVRAFLHAGGAICATGALPEVTVDLE